MDDGYTPYTFYIIREMICKHKKFQIWSALHFQYSSGVVHTYLLALLPVWCGMVGYDGSTGSSTVVVVGTYSQQYRSANQNIDQRHYLIIIQTVRTIPVSLPVYISGTDIYNLKQSVLIPANINATPACEQSFCAYNNY